MSFKTDCGGLALRANIKVSTQASTWNTRLNQLFRGSAPIILCTFSLPKNPAALDGLLGKRCDGITIIANSKFADEARLLKARYPGLTIILCPQTHAKLALAAPDRVWLSSENLTQGSNFENTVGIHSRAVYEFYLSELMGNGLLNPGNELEVLPE